MLVSADFLRDNMFGVAKPWGGPLLTLSKYPLIVVGMTWGALVMIGCSVVASMPLSRTSPAATPDEQLPLEKGTNDTSVDRSPAVLG
ncbi:MULTISPECIES: hypothetical protein [Streptomyces]|uniref:hypothetical protein n=1 Tax=Streptomyces TaxID=1883 RepID=UPI001C2F8C1E|nr:hypothetical protein [Streptomyces sp. GbtcB7]